MLCAVATATTRAARRTPSGHASVAERRARGKGARRTAPRSSHGEWAPARGRPDPVSLLEEQGESRVPELLPIRYGRMSASPFAFFRGAAYVMASDLADTPGSGMEVQLCGDAHLSNFGGFAGPARRLVFDLNDFDETLPGPWEWDVKRLAASLLVAARQRELSTRQGRRVVATGVERYRTAMREFAEQRNLEVWYSRIEFESRFAAVRDHLDRDALKRAERNLAKARRKDSLRAFSKLTRMEDGEPRLVSDPPLLVPLSELLEEAGLGDYADVDARIQDLLRAYRGTLRGELRRLLEGYRYVDIARKVVGVGSVGTRAWIVLLLGRDTDDPLFLQIKEAQRSVLERFTAPSTLENQGQRVVEGQRLMQAAGDIMLGWLRVPGPDGIERDFYVRQLWDWKASFEIDAMDATALGLYAGLCGETLARAHARSGDRVAIAGYLGRGRGFDEALCDFAEAYADQNERDHRALVQAIEEGRVAAETDV